MTRQDAPGLPGPVSRNPRHHPTGVAGLTLQELVTARRLLAGHTPARMAAEWGVSCRAVVHPRIDQLRRKLGIGTRAELREWVAAHADEIREES